MSEIDGAKQKTSEHSFFWQRIKGKNKPCYGQSLDRMDHYLVESVVSNIREQFPGLQFGSAHLQPLMEKGNKEARIAFGKLLFGDSSITDVKILPEENKLRGGFEFYIRAE